MRILVSLFSIIALGGVVNSQPLGYAYWNKIKERADSVVISRFGTDFFLNHIFTPESSIGYIVVGESSCGWAERDTIRREPTSCYFEYDIGLDPLHVSRMNISFSITPKGELIEDEDLRGFIADSAPVKFYSDLQGFILLAKRNGVKCKPVDAFVELQWVRLDSASGISPDGVGRYELVLGRVMGTHSERISNSVHTYRLIDAITFDPFSGAVLRKEKFHLTLSWACGAANL